jgi:hypothetical protein
MDAHDLHKVLVDTRNLLAKDGWVKGKSIGRAHPKSNPTQDEFGRCIGGAIGHVVHASYELGRSDPITGAFGCIDRMITRHTGLPTTVYNDHPATTKSDVLNLLDKLIAETAPPPVMPEIEIHEEEKVLV